MLKKVMMVMVVGSWYSTVCASEKDTVNKVWKDITTCTGDAAAIAGRVSKAITQGERDALATHYEASMQSCLSKVPVTTSKIATASASRSNGGDPETPEC